MYATTVGLPVVPDEAWMRARREGSTASIPSGYVSRRSSLCVNGNPHEVVERPDVVRLDVAEPVAVERDDLPHSLDRRAQALELQLGEAFARKRLERGLEDHVGGISRAACCDSPPVTIDRSKVWTGELNARALEPQPRVTVGLYDTTLRDGEQSVGVVLSPEEKLEIATALAAAGVDRIEAGFPRVSDDDAKAISLVLEAELDAEIWGFSRAVRADVDALVELGLQASVIESPISDAKLAALGVTHETMLERIRSAISHAVENGIRVAFFGVDSTRADLEFVRRAYESAVDAGAAEVVVVDTLGIATPEAAAFLVGEVADRLGPDVPVHWHGHNDFGLATAAAVAAVQAGATWVQGTVNGMGERAGNADLVEVALALEALYGIPTRLRFEQARELAGLVERLSGTPLAAWKPVTGRQPVHARVGGRRGAVPRPACDRAVLVGARGRRAGHRPRKEERDRLDPDQGRRARARRARGPVRRASRGGEESGRPEGPPRHGRRVPAPRPAASVSLTKSARLLRPQGRLID